MYIHSCGLTPRVPPCLPARSPTLVIAYPCSKALRKVVISNVKSVDPNVLGRITSYRLRFGDGASLAFADAGAKATYTVQRAKNGTWAWKK